MDNLRLNRAVDALHQRVTSDDQQPTALAAKVVTAPPTSTVGSFVFNNVQVTLPNGKVILDKVSGHAMAGHVTALMGPSGAGMTLHAAFSHQPHLHPYVVVCRQDNVAKRSIRAS